MQRLILIGLTACILLGALGLGGLWFYRKNRPDSQWVPIPLNEKTSREERASLQKKLDEALHEPEILANVVKKLQLQSRWKLSTEQEATQQLAGMLFVRQGEFKNTSTGMTFPTIDVGVKGKRKDNPILGEIAVRLGQETRQVLGITEQ